MPLCIFLNSPLALCSRNQSLPLNTPIPLVLLLMESCGSPALTGYAEAQLRQYQRLTKQIKPDMESYERQREEWCVKAAG